MAEERAGYEIRREVKCPSCKGTGKFMVHLHAGADSGWRNVVCARCGGTGREVILAKQLPMELPGMADPLAGPSERGW